MVTGDSEHTGEQAREYIAVVTPQWRQLRFRGPELGLSLLLAILIQLEIWVFDPGSPTLARSVVGMVAAGSLAFLSGHPFGAYVANGFSIYAFVALGHPSDFYQWTNFIAIFAVASRTALRPALTALALGLIGVGAYFWRFPDEGGAIFAGFVGAVWVAAWFAGRAQLSRFREVELERERDLSRAELAARSEAEAERQQLARELHDIIGHAVNVMVVHAGAAAATLSTDPARSENSLATIAATGRSALADLDRMLSLLQGDAARGPLPGLAHLEQLVAGFADSGVDVDLEISGDVSRVPASVALTGHRLVQEALTNVLKHADATSAGVRVEVDEALAVSVSDNGRGGDVIVGRGLQGMMDRAELHGGAVTFRAPAGGGFVVDCRIPLEQQG